MNALNGIYAGSSSTIKIFCFKFKPKPRRNYFKCNSWNTLTNKQLGKIIVPEGCRFMIVKSIVARFAMQNIFWTFRTLAYTIYSMVKFAIAKTNFNRIIYSKCALYVFMKIFFYSLFLIFSCWPWLRRWKKLRAGYRTKTKTHAFQTNSFLPFECSDLAWRPKLELHFYQIWEDIKKSLLFFSLLHSRITRVAFLDICFRSSQWRILHASKQARSQDLEKEGAILKEWEKFKRPWPEFSLFLNQFHTVCPKIQTKFLGKLGNLKFFSAQNQVVSKKKKVFAEIETDFSAEIGNSKVFSAQNQVVSKKKKKSSSPKLRLIFRPNSEIQTFEGGLFSYGGAIFNFSQ